MKTLYILRGLPGSGKSTLANTIVDTIAVCEADQYFVDKETGEYKFNPDEIKIAHQWCRDEVENRMKHNQDTYGLDYSEIVVSNTFTQEWEMEPYYKCESCGCQVGLISPPLFLSWLCSPNIFTVVCCFPL